MVKDCPTCLGTGVHVWVVHSNITKSERPVVNPCSSCRGLGIVPNELADDLISTGKPFPDE